MVLTPVGEYNLEVNVNSDTRVSEVIAEDRVFDLVEQFVIESSFSGDVSASVDVTGEGSGSNTKTATLQDSISKTISSDTDLALADNQNVSFNVDTQLTSNTTENQLDSGSGYDDGYVRLDQTYYDKIQLEGDSYTSGIQLIFKDSVYVGEYNNDIQLYRIGSSGQGTFQNVGMRNDGIVEDLAINTGDSSYNWSVYEVTTDYGVDVYIS